MTKKNKIIIGICTIAAIIVIACILIFVLSNKETKANVKNVAKVSITNGNNGETIILDKEEDIKLITDFIGKCTFKYKDRKGYSGWLYKLDFEYNSGNKSTIVYSGKVGEIHNKDCVISGGELEEFEAIYNKLK